QISDSIDRLNDSKPTDLDKILSEEFTNFSKVQKQIKIIDTTVHVKLTQDAQAVVDDNIKLGQKIIDDLQQSSSEDTHEEKDEDPELENKIIPELEPIENLK